MSKKFYSYDEYTSDRSLPKSTFYFQRNKEKNKILNKFNELFPDFQNQSENISSSENESFQDFFEGNQTDKEEIIFSSDESEVDPEEKDDIDDHMNFEFDDNESVNLSDEEKVELVNVCLLTLFYAGKMTMSSLRLVIRLIKIISNIQISERFDQLSKKILFVTQEKIDYKKKWYCSLCKKYCFLEHSKQRLCQNCKSRLQIFYHIPIENQIRRLFKKHVLPVNKKEINDENLIIDVIDSEFYQRFRSKIEFSNKNYYKTYSFLFNTDGIELSSKSKISIWPVYLAINEIPIESRFFIDNIIIAGILISDGKPKDLDVFFQQILMDLKLLEIGFDYNDEIYKFYVIYGIFDKPARSLITNMTMASGNYGCLKCKQKGTSIPFGNGYHHVFGYSEKMSELRNNKEYLKDVEASILDSKFSNGVKGPSFLSELKFYKPVESTLIDSMHSLFLGVIKTLFKYWFDYPSSNSFSLKENIDEINRRYLSIRPPSHFSYAPRDIKNFKLWRAHEFMNFAFFYSIPVFFQIMPDKYFQNLICLLIPLEILYQKKINKHKLIIAEKLLKNFLADLEKLYDPHIMLSGVHELIHLVDSTRHSGPLNNLSCFPFEELNRKLTSMINGKDLIGDEFIKLWSLSQCLGIYVMDKKAENNYIKFIRENFGLKTSNLKIIKKKNF